MASAQVFAQGMPPTVVETEAITQVEFHDQITLIGRTEAWVTSEIVAEVDGRVESINAGEGVATAKGNPVVTLDRDRLSLIFEARFAQSEQTRLEAELAKSNLRRTEELFAQKLVPESTLDSVRIWASITENRYRQLDAEQKQLALDLDHAVIKAPFSGYTGRKLVDVGEWVSIGMPVFEMVDISRIRVRVDLPERYFGRLYVGSDVRIVVTNGAEHTLSGEIVGVSPNASQETHTFPVIIAVNNRDNGLAGGMLVRATLSLDNVFESLAVSKDAIVRFAGQTMVYTVADGKAAPIPVTVGSTDGKMVAVSGPGLQAGMPVVVRGNERVQPGAPVMVASGPGGSEPPTASAEQPGGQR